MKKLTKEQIQANLEDLIGWTLTNNAIEKQFQFKDFIEALSFVNAVALEAEKMDHHPDINIHSYNKVKIILSTHSEGGVTNKDFNLAEKIENSFKKDF